MWNYKAQHLKDTIDLTVETPLPNHPDNKPLPAQESPNTLNNETKLPLITPFHNSYMNGLNSKVNH